MQTKGGPVAEAAGASHTPCADYGTEERANALALDEYVTWLVANRGAVEIAAVRYEQRPDGVAKVVTEVRAGGRRDALRVVYDAELVAHETARHYGGTAAFVFRVIDLDVEDEGPRGPSYKRLV